jgi:hypothetical protein
VIEANKAFSESSPFERNEAQIRQGE